jgi:GNAT superfamily N-acetyltransferase
MTSRLAPGSSWRAWLAERGDELLGNVWVELIEKMPNPIAEPEENGYLTNFYVVPRAQGMGVGTALLDAALTWCRDRQVHAVILWPTRRSRPLYERHGFAPPAALMEKVVTGEGAPWPSAH